jgi:hypothetical protein
MMRLPPRESAAIHRRDDKARLFGRAVEFNAGD